MRGPDGAFLSGFRDADHKFEWGREEFRAWAVAVAGSGYDVSFATVGAPWGSTPDELAPFGGASQVAVFVRRDAGTGAAPEPRPQSPGQGREEAGADDAGAWGEARAAQQGAWGLPSAAEEGSTAARAAVRALAEHEGRGDDVAAVEDGLTTTEEQKKKLTTVWWQQK